MTLNGFHFHTIFDAAQILIVPLLLSLHSTQVNALLSAGVYVFLFNHNLYSVVTIASFLVASLMKRK